MTTFSSFAEWRMWSTASGGRSRTGSRMSQPCDAKIASRIFIRQDASIGIRDHGTSAPSATLRSRSGITRSASITSCVPIPVQVGHAPCGELNEKERGSSSSIVVPSYGHEYRSL